MTHIGPSSRDYVVLRTDFLCIEGGRGKKARREMRLEPAQSYFSLPMLLPKFLLAPGAFLCQMSDHQRSSLPENQEDTGFVTGDDLSAKWTNYFRLAFGRMTDDGARQWKKARDERNEATDITRCEKHRDYLLAYSRCSVQQ